MEDSFKGLLITITVMGLFITAILSYIVIFPQEQGISYESIRDSETYLTVSEINVNNTYYLQNINNKSNIAFDEWDITQGFMGTNTIKQGSKSGVENYRSNIFDTLGLLATQVFGEQSPIVYAIGILSLLSVSVVIYIIYALVRIGR